MLAACTRGQADPWQAHNRPPITPCSCPLITRSSLAHRPICSRSDSMCSSAASTLRPTCARARRRPRQHFRPSMDWHAPRPRSWRLSSWDPRHRIPPRSAPGTLPGNFQSPLRRTARGADRPSCPRADSRSDRVRTSIRALMGQRRREYTSLANSRSAALRPPRRKPAPGAPRWTTLP